MRKPVYSTKFKKDYKRCIKRGYSMQKITDVMYKLENEIPLPPELKEHRLLGEYADCLECHMEPDWLLMYIINDDAENNYSDEVDEIFKEVYFVRTGTHNDLFE